MQINGSNEGVAEMQQTKTPGAEGSPSPLKEKIFFPNLDGLRFFCFVFVFLFHSFATEHNDIKEHKLYLFVKGHLVANGNMGVNFFFVLSGFLITYLLITEKEKFRKINIGNFYVRRILRIWPLFYFCVFFGFVIFPILKTYAGQVPNESANWLYYVTFLNNFDFVHKMPIYGPPDASTLGVLWSVAIEEQFYFVWPLLLALIPRRYYLGTFIAIIIGSAAFRYHFRADYFTTEHHTLSCISDMTVGGFFATLIYFNRSFKSWVENLNKYFIYFIYLVIVILIFFRCDIFYLNGVTIMLEKIVLSLVFIMVILEQSYAKNSFFKMSRFKFISRLGTYTYGMYCLHFIAILAVSIILRKIGWDDNVYEVIFLEGSLSLVLTIVIAYFSHRYYESWFLKFKSKFSRISKF